MIGFESATMVHYFTSKSVTNVTYIIGISAIGYVLLVVSEYVPALGLVASALIGVGMAACALLPLFAVFVVKQYPSKFIVPSYIGLAMLAVVVQSVLVEAFRTSTVLLNISYLAVVIILAFIFMAVEPFLIYAMRRKFEESVTTEQAEAAAEDAISADEQETALALLTNREKEIAGLISSGHSNKDIAIMLVLSEHTIKDHTKNIYRKLDIHSRYELTALINRLKSK